MMKPQRTEQGQALVLIILALVGMMGFAALAVDFGRLYAERRRAQSAVDSAAMSAAFANSQGDSWETAAWTTLGENDYFDVDPVFITLANPPVSGPYSDAARTDIDVNEYYQVVIETEVMPIFAQFVYGGPMPVRVEAVAHSSPVTSISPGNAITATGRNTCPGIVWNGNIDTLVDGGSVFSNAEGTRTGSCRSAISTGGSGNISVIDGEVRVATDYEGSATIDPPVVQEYGFQTFPPVPEPFCDDLPEGTIDNTNNILHAGKHTIALPNSFKNDDWTLGEGMHCFYQSLEKNGGSLRSSGYGTFIVMKEGGVSFGGNANTKLRAIFSGPDGNGYRDGKDQQWSGMLLYMPMDNHNGLDLSGNSGTSYTGTIYAPGPRNPDTQEKCNVGGTGDSYGLHAALICSTVGIAGTSDITVIYREQENYRLPPAVELSQ